MKTRMLLLPLLVLSALAAFSLAGEPVRLEGSDMPKLIKHAAPTYPPDAKKNGIQGKVELDVTVDETGKVKDIKVLKSPDESLAQAAADAVKQWEYEPFKKGGKARAFLCTVAVMFKLQ